MKFPVYQDDGRALFNLTHLQSKAVKTLRHKIDSGEYKRVKNKCYCRCSEDKGTLIAEKDMHGLPLRSFLCRKTGLVCSEHVLDEKSTHDFYIKEYRDLVSFGISISEYFDSQAQRGKHFYRLFKENVQEPLEFKIVDIGCGAGGVLHSFFKNQNQCIGFDYNTDYLAYGKAKGLDLKWGNYKGRIEHHSVDMVILSHVMEHFLNPLQEIQDVIEIIKPNGYLIVEVPGVYFKYYPTDTPLKHLQMAHVVNYFHEDFLHFFFKELNMNVCYGDERCTFILKKNRDWKRIDQMAVPQRFFEKKFEAIREYLWETQSTYNKDWKNFLSRFLVSLGVMKFIRPLAKWIKQCKG